MSYVFYNGKLVRKGDNLSCIFLDASSNVIGKSINNPPPNVVTTIDNVPDIVFSTIMAKNHTAEFYHRLSSGDGMKVEDYEKVYAIDVLRQMKMSEIDTKTDELVLVGYEFSGSRFSTTIDDQKNWLALFVAKDNLSYPFPVTTQDGDTYIFSSIQEMAAFYFTGVSFVYSVYSGARSIKKQIIEAQTKDEIDAVVDPR